MKKTFVKPEMKCHKLRGNEMILVSCDAVHCLYLHGDDCDVVCEKDEECFLDCDNKDNHCDWLHE